MSFILKMTVMTVLIFASLLGCQKGVPEIASLRSLQGFSVDQKTFSVTSKTNPDFTLSGRCLPQFNSIEISFNRGSDWQPISKYSNSVSMNCASSGTFTALLSLPGTSLDASKWSSSGSYEQLFVRGVSEFGYSQSIALELVHLKGLLGSFTGAGSNSPLTGGSYKLSGEVTGFATSPSMSGGNYKLQGEILW